MHFLKTTATAITGLFVSTLAHAQDLPQIPQEFHGYWAVPSCQEPEIVYVTFGGADLYIDIMSEEASLSVISDSFSYKGWTVVVPDYPENFWMLKKNADGTVTDAYPIYPTDEERATNPDVWEPDPYNINLARIDSSMEPLLPCDSLPPSFWALHGEGLAFFKAFDAASRDCSGEASCFQALFDIFDVTKDGSLGRAELARAARMIGYLMVFRDDFYYSLEELAQGQGVGVVVGIAGAEILLRNYDYNDDQAISLNELLLDRQQILAEDFQLSFKMLRDSSEVGELVMEGADTLEDILR